MAGGNAYPGQDRNGWLRCLSSAAHRDERGLVPHRGPFFVPEQSKPMTLSAAPQRYVNNVARQSGSNFYFSFFSLPKEQREAITAVYAFCREVDDAVDRPGLQDPAQEIARWREEIARTYD